MDLKLLKERETPLLSRKRVTFEATFKGPTPTRDAIQEAVSKALKTDKELTIIKHIYTRYGLEKTKIIAHIYSKKEDMQRYEEKSVLKKHEKKEAPKEEKKE